MRGYLYITIHAQSDEEVVGGSGNEGGGVSGEEGGGVSGEDGGGVSGEEIEKFPCGECVLEVKDNDEAIYCESGCGQWYHRSG